MLEEDGNRSTSKVKLMKFKTLQQKMLIPVQLDATVPPFQEQEVPS